MRYVSVLLIVALGTLGSGCSCVTREEHRAFVEASRRYVEASGPIIREVSERDRDTGRITSTSCANRVGMVTDFERAVADAEKRTK